jgi:hypothetical protein
MKFIKKTILKISLEALDYISLKVKRELEKIDGESKNETAKDNN